MRLTFLGTGTSQGIPVIGSDHAVCLSKDWRDKRMRSSVLLEWDGFTYVIDCGPDFRQQMLANAVRRLDGIIFTHYHADHTAGIDDVRSFSLRQGSVDIYAQRETLDNLKERFAYIFATVNKYAGAPNLNATEISLSPFMLSGRAVVPVEVMHGKLPILGFRIGKMAYITDAKYIEARELEKLKDLDVLVLNALRIDPHPTHLNLEEALELISRIKPKRAYLTHISHLLGFHAEVSETLPPNVFLAYDGLSLEV